MKDLIFALAWVWEVFSPVIIITTAISVLLFVFRIAIHIFEKIVSKTEEATWPRPVEENDWDDQETWQEYEDDLKNNLPDFEDGDCQVVEGTNNRLHLLLKRNKVVILSRSKNNRRKP